MELSPALPIMVALRKESVDRNYLSLNTQQRHLPVALRKESVDRNLFDPARRFENLVALRKESVDRNAGVPEAD